MRKFYLVRGVKGILVGDPWRPQGFIGQTQLRFAKGELPKCARDRFEPCLAAVPHHPEVMKPLAKGHLEVVEEFWAKNIKEAFAKRDAYQVSKPPPPTPAPKLSKGDDK